MITLRTIKADPAIHGIELAVTQEGMVVSVAGGSFKFGGQDYSLPQTDYTAPEEGNDVGVTAWLAKERDGGLPVLVVDESRSEGAFVWAESPYEKMDILFEMLVPAGATTLDDVDINVRHLVAPPQKPVPEPEPVVELTEEELEAKRAARRAFREAKRRVNEEAVAARRVAQAARDADNRAAREAAKDALDLDEYQEAGE